MPYKDAYRDLSKAYEDELRYLYSDSGLLYMKYDPARSTKTTSPDAWWSEEDEENTLETSYYLRA